MDDIFMCLLHRKAALQAGAIREVTRRASELGISYPVTVSERLCDLLGVGEGAEKQPRLDAVLQGLAKVFPDLSPCEACIRYMRFDVSLPVSASSSSVVNLGFLVEHFSDASGFILLLLPDEFSYGPGPFYYFEYPRLN